LFPTDPISRLFQNMQQANAPAASDATSVLAKIPFHTPQIAGRVGPASPVHAAAPVGGALGHLLAMGNTVDTGLRERAQTGLKPQDYLTLASLAAPALRALPFGTAAAAPVAEAATATSEIPFPAEMSKEALAQNVAHFVQQQNAKRQLGESFAAHQAILDARGIRIGAGTQPANSF
jgi:hypothetical protein